MNDIPKAISLKIKSMQRGEITEYYVYKNIAKRVKDASNKEILLKIANDEMRHYNVWKTFLGEEAKPNRLKIFYFTTLAFLFGYTFTLKLMERGEDRANDYYTEIGEYS
ncbi:MAG: rubrerythrin family protein, partial [Candidatus Izemoplasmatales bacterium]